MPVRRIPNWLLLALFSSLFAPCISILPSSVEHTGPYVPRRYIVEMHGDTKGKREVHEEVYHHLRKRDISIVVHNEYTTPGIFVGASLEIPSAEDLLKVAKIPGVKAIREVMYIHRTREVSSNDTKGLGAPHDEFSTHLMTGVDKLHAQKLYGDGIKIGIIDTGIDYNHPALGGGKGPGHKVIGGYDFCGDDFTGQNTPVPDDDPLATCNSHGTQVAGVIGANFDSKLGIKGVSPKASIAAYRVFGCKGGTSEDVVLKAMERAVADGMDILSLSLGIPSGWSANTLSIVANRIATIGYVVVAAAGNDGSQGPWFSASPGNGANVISVGSVNNNLIPAHEAKVSGADHPPIPYIRAYPFNITTNLLVYALSNSKVPDDGCKPLPDSTPDLSGHVVVIRQAGCGPALQVKNAASKGAKAFLYTPRDDRGLTTLPIDNTAMIPSADGAFLSDQFTSGTSLKLSFPNIEGTKIDFKTKIGGLMSSSSSVGPTFDMQMKPSLAAPGKDIWTIVPVSQGSYAVFSGTSMAAPLVAGAAALVLEAKGRKKDVAKSIKDLFQSTAVAVGDPMKSSLLQTVSRQGAGLIRVDQAANTKTIVTPAQILLNDTAHFVPSHKITIKNSGQKPMTYKLSHLPAATAFSKKPNSPFVGPSPMELSDGYASVNIEPSQLTVPPDSSAQVSLTFTAPKNVDESRLPIFSGYVQIESAAETLHVTYLGAVGNLKNQVVLDTATKFAQFEGLPLPISLGPGDKPVDSKASVVYSMKDKDHPTILYRLAFGSPLVRFELCARDADPKAGTPTLGRLNEAHFLSRHANEHDESNLRLAYSRFEFKGTFANASRVLDGEYRILLRALKVTGDPQRMDDYESWLSPPFRIKST